MTTPSLTPKPIGTVIVLVGRVTAVDPIGNGRVLHIGDAVLPRDSLQSDAGAFAQVRLTSGRLVDLGHDTEFDQRDSVSLIRESIDESTTLQIAAAEKQYADRIANLEKRIASGEIAAIEELVSMCSTDYLCGRPRESAVIPDLDNEGHTPIIIKQSVPPQIPVEAGIEFISTAQIAATPPTLAFQTQLHPPFVLSATSSDETLQAHTPADTFRWTSADQGTPAVPAIDTVIGFTSTNATKLDLSTMLQGEYASASNLADYLRFEKSGNDTILHVAATSGGPEVQRIVLQGADLVTTTGGTLSNHQIIQQLLDHGKLLVDA